MRIVVQRVTNAKVEVDQNIVGAIDKGYLLLVAFTHTDTLNDIEYTTRKIANLRIFEDKQGKMNLSINDVGGAILSISQFTLYGDTSKGNRPSFIDSARPEQAESLYNQFNDILRNKYNLHVETGIFGADMKVSFTNDGPVTVVIDSKIK